MNNSDNLDILYASDGFELESEEKKGSAFNDLFDTVVDMLKLIKHNIIIFIAVIAIFSAGAFAYSVRSYEELYKVSSTFSITPLVSSDAGSKVSTYMFNYTATFSEQLAATFPYIAQSNNLRDVIRNDLGGYINGHIEAVAVTNTNVFQVSTVSSSPDDAVKIMDSFIENFPKISNYIIGDTRLNMIYQSPKPTKPINTPDHLRHTFYGFAFGLLINLVVFFLLALGKETVKNKNDIKQKLNSRCICEIPRVAEKHGGHSKNSLIRVGSKRPAFSESIRALKKRTVALLGENDKIIGVTSAKKNEGKTTVAFNLANLFVTGGAKVLLIDINMKNTDLQRFMLKDPKISNGISDYCKGKVMPSEMVYKYKNDFDIIFCGAEIPKLDSVKLNELFEYVKNDYDYIVVDMPCCTSGADVSMIADMCDDLIFTVLYDHTSVKDIKNAFRSVLYSKARFLGFVVNESAQSSSGYYTYGRYSNGYRYNYYGRYKSKYGYGIDDIKPEK